MALSCCFAGTMGVLCRPSPGLLGPVSGERIAPSGCSRIAIAPFFKHPLLAMSVVSESNLANPQSAEPQALGIVFSPQTTP